MTLHVQVKPGARADTVLAWDPERCALQVTVTAPPVDGKANTAVERLIAARLGVPRTRVSVVGGASARHKRVEVPDEADLTALAP